MSNNPVRQRNCGNCRFSMDPVICHDCVAFNKHMFKSSAHGTPDNTAPAMDAKKRCDTCGSGGPVEDECTAPGVCIDYSHWIPMDRAEIDQYQTNAQHDPTGKNQHEAGAKLDAGKTKWHLMPWKIIEGVAKVMTFGAAKYSADGWKAVPQAKQRYFSAMMRHWMLMEDGEYTDPDSGLPHWAHFCCNAVFLGYFALQAEVGSMGSATKKMKSLLKKV